MSTVKTKPSTERTQGKVGISQETAAILREIKAATGIPHARIVRDAVRNVYEREFRKRRAS